MAFISIVVPTFNRASLLERCLKSVLTQSIPDMEVLVGDNASEDETQDVLKSIVDERLVVFRNDTNIGIEKNILSLLKNAHGKWVFYLTDDDYLLPDGLQRLLSIVRSDESLGVVLSSTIVVDIDGKPLWTHHYYEGTRKFAPGMDALKNLVVPSHVLSRVLVRKEWVDVVGVERTFGSLYPQMYIVGSVLKEHYGYYLAETVIAHTTGNETAWGYPADFMVGGRIKVIKDMLPSAQWKREQGTLIDLLIDEIKSSHIRLSWQVSINAFINHQKELLKYPEIACSIKYWRYLILFLLDKVKEKNSKIIWKSGKFLKNRK